MILRAAAFLLVMVFAAPTFAESPSPFTKQHAQAMAVLDAPLRPKVQAAARVLRERLAMPLPPKAKPRDVLATARQVVVDQSYLGLATRQSSNIDTVVLLVLMEASQQNDQDVARLTSERAAIAAIKACNRDAKCLGQLTPTAPLTVADLDRLRAQWQTKASSLDELDAADMLLLQQMMEKKSQLESMISNVMKAGYEGGQAAVQALKAS